MSDHDHGHGHGHPHGAPHGHGPMIPPPADLKNIRNVLLVGSGKGGVGKSTVAFNLALSLVADGLKVGLLDGDLYGPSVPILAGIQGERLGMNEAQKIVPVEKHGLKMISLGLLMKDTDAIVWRGPLLHKTMRQFFLDVEWGDLDVLVVDLPPGTGDIQLSIMQLVKVSGALVVTTPQELAFADVLRAVKMFEKLQIPVLGLVENMASFTAPDTGATYWPFGKGRIAEHCATHAVPHLGQIPIVPAIAAASDAGQPIVDDQAHGGVRQHYRALAAALRTSLA